MTTVAQFIDYLKTLPPETQIRVLEERTRNWETTTQWANLDVNDNCYYWMRGNGRYLDLGSN